MLVRTSALLALVALAFLAPPAVRSADTSASGFTSRGNAVIRITFSGTPIDLGANIALAQRNSTYRLDILSLAIPGTDPTLNAIAQSLLPTGGYTIIFDRAKASTIVWSSSKRTYAILGSGSENAPAGKPAPSTTPHSISGSLQKLKAMTLSLSLAGHGTTNGHPTTGLDYAVNFQLDGKQPYDVSGRAQLADDLDEIPVQFQIQAKEATPNGQSGAMRIDVTSIQRAAPDATQFDVPAGYTRVSDVKDVVGKVF